MTKANEIHGGIVPPQARPAEHADKAPATLPSQQAQKTATQDAARIAQQAGFQRLAKKTRKGLDIGDSSHAPIPLPGDDVDPDAWSPEKLDEAQEDLTLASTRLEELENATGEEQSLAGGIARSSFFPTEEGAQKLQELADRPAPEGPGLDEVTASVEKLFHIKLDERVSLGHKMLAAGLVVAGEALSVKVDPSGIRERELAGGIKKVTQRGNQAVGEAQKMSKGITRELSAQRTFVSKR